MKTPTDFTPCPLLAAETITVRYGERTACWNVGLEIYPGEVVGIVGESGSGKTTLLNCLSGRLAPSSGIVRYSADGMEPEDLYDMTESRRRMLMRTE